jgi:predicted  nucleic acid-binding Zn-ribbon protein
MPHQCTNCDRVFPDGSKEMLSGCPDCGGNKFQFRPDSQTETPTLGSEGDDDSGGPVSSPSPSSGSSSPSSSAQSPDKPSSASSSSPSSTPNPSPSSDPDFIEAESDPSVLPDTGEDDAQTDARRSVVSPEELDSAATPPEARDDVAETVPPDPDQDAPGIEDLRRELNDQFESIKILEPGQYELNLMELYDRQECIISLQEDGHYVIEVADTWREDR